MELASFYAIHKAAHMVGIGDERAVIDLLSRQIHILKGVIKGPQGEEGFAPEFGHEVAFEIAFVNQVQATVGVVNQHDLSRAQLVLTQRQGPQHIVGNQPTGIAQNVRLTRLKAEGDTHLDTRVHARHDGKPGFRAHLKAF